jgi:hypothetical protein
MTAHWIGGSVIKFAMASAYMLPVFALGGSEPLQHVPARPSAVTTGRTELPFIAQTQANVPFTIHGAVAGPLLIGDSVPIVLTITNPNGHPITIRELSVEVNAVKTARPAAQCGAGDFAVRQPGPDVRLVVPATSTASLAALGLTAAQQPAVMLVDRSAHNQDGCKGAAVSLAAHGTATGAQP